MPELDANISRLIDQAFNRRGYIQSSTLAALLGVSQRSVQRWVDEGLIVECDYSLGGGRMLFSREAVERIVKEGIVHRVLGDVMLPGQMEMEFKK